MRSTREEAKESGRVREKYLGRGQYIAKERKISK